MEWADLWFRIEGKRLNFPLLPKRVFIATDDPSVITEAREKYGSNGWMIFGNDEIANGRGCFFNIRIFFEFFKFNKINNLIKKIF